MMTPKPKRVKEIQIVNRLIAALTPYLLFEKEFTRFVKDRTLAQIEEIKDEDLRYSTLSFYYFCVGDVALGCDYAENALKIIPNDISTWKNYTLCLLWRTNAVKALEVAKRSVEMTKSPIMAHDVCFFALSAGDYASFFDAYDFLTRSEMLSEVFTEDEAKAMRNGLSHAELARKYQKFEVLKSLSALMFEKLTIQQALEVKNNLFDVSSDDEESTLIYEIYVFDADAAQCAAMNVELISDRVKKGITDWTVGGVFVNQDTEIDDSVRNAE
jgi:hypothetical protein